VIAMKDLLQMMEQVHLEWVRSYLVSTILRMVLSERGQLQALEQVHLTPGEAAFLCHTFWMSLMSLWGPRAPAGGESRTGAG